MGLKHVLAHAAWTTEAAARALGTDYNGAYNYRGSGPAPNDPAIFTDTPMPDDTLQLHARELPVRNDASVGRQGRPSNSELNERPINQRLNGLLDARFRFGYSARAFVLATRNELSFWLLGTSVRFGYSARAFVLRGPRPQE